MSDKVKCPFCSKSLTFPGLQKHIFSGMHKEQIHALLHKRKKYLLKEITDYKHTERIPFVSIGSDTRLHLCFGCNKCYLTNSQNLKKHSCPKVDDGFTLLRKMLEEKPVIEDEEPQAPPLPTPTPTDFTDPEGKGRPLAVVISDFQRKIQRLNSIIESDKQTVEEAEEKSAKADMFLAGLNYAIEYIKGEQKEVYQSFLPNFKEEHTELLPFVKL